MNRQPSFIDNRDGNTLAQALGSLLGVPPSPRWGSPPRSPIR